MSIDFNNLTYLQVKNRDIQQVKNFISSVRKCKKWSDGWISFSEAHQVITLKKTNCFISNNVF